MVSSGRYNVKKILKRQKIQPIQIIILLQKKIMMRVAITEMETIKKEEEVVEEAVQADPTAVWVYPGAQYLQAATAPATVAAALVVPVGATSEYPVAQNMQFPVKDPAAEATPVVTSAYPAAHFPAVVSVFKTQAAPVTEESSFQ